MTTKKGSQVNDVFLNQDGKTETNFSGGIQGATTWPGVLGRGRTARGRSTRPNCRTLSIAHTVQVGHVRLGQRTSIDRTRSQGEQAPRISRGSSA